MTNHNYTVCKGSDHNYTECKGSDHNYTVCKGSDHNYTVCKGSDHVIHVDINNMFKYYQEFIITEESVELTTSLCIRFSESHALGIC